MPELLVVDWFNVLAAFLLLAGFILLSVGVAISGFGVPGISGILCLVAGIMLAADSFLEGLIITLVVLALLGVICVAVLKLIASGRLKMPIILQDEQTREEGYLSANDLNYLLGKEGIAATDLRPSGVGEFEGISFDVISSGAYINKGTALVIAKVEGAKLIVKEVRK